MFFLLKNPKLFVDKMSNLVMLSLLAGGIITMVIMTIPSSRTCNPAKVVLSESKQWQHEEGYWIGEYSMYNSDGEEYTTSWNYPYDHYKGFITGNVKGNAYRQRNVFMYPPQKADKCDSPEDVQGTGACSVNGNMKVFEADQSTLICSLNPELKGDIEGPYGSMAYTYTELIGQNNSLLYQVWLNPIPAMGIHEKMLMQSQLTTITESGGTVYRTRTAQGFNAFGPNAGTPSYASYYREHKVSKEEFWRQFEQTKIDYNILNSDTCAWKSLDTGGTGATGTSGIDACRVHLEESFEL